LIFVLFVSFSILKAEWLFVCQGHYHTAPLSLLIFLLLLFSHLIVEPNLHDLLRNWLSFKHLIFNWFYCLLLFPCSLSFLLPFFKRKWFWYSYFDGFKVLLMPKLI